MYNGRYAQVEPDYTSPDADFSQAEQITHSGALLVGTYDNFTDGDPVEFLKNLNRQMPTADQNDLIFIEKTGHTYQIKNGNNKNWALR